MQFVSQILILKWYEMMWNDVICIRMRRCQEYWLRDNSEKRRTRGCEVSLLVYRATWVIEELNKLPTRWSLLSLWSSVSLWISSQSVTRNKAAAAFIIRVQIFFKNIWYYVGFSNDWTVLTQSDVKGMWLDDKNSSFKVTCLQEGSETRDL